MGGINIRKDVNKNFKKNTLMEVEGKPQKKRVSGGWGREIKLIRIAIVTTQ